MAGPDQGWEEANQRLGDIAMSLMLASQNDMKDRAVESLRAASDVFHSHRDMLDNLDRRIVSIEQRLCALEE